MSASEGVWVRALDASDADAFLALTRRCDVGTGRFVVDRSPDPFALGRHFGPTLTLGVFEGGVFEGGVFEGGVFEGGVFEGGTVDRGAPESGAPGSGAFERGAPRGGDLVATAALSTVRRHVAGTLRTLDYLHDLRVAPDARGRGLARALGEEVRRRSRAGGWSFGTILDDNPLAHAIAMGTGAYLGEARALGRSAHVVLPTPDPTARDGAHRGARAVRISEVRFAEAHARLASRDGYAPEARLEGEALAFEDRGTVVAVARLVSEDARRRFVVEGRPIALGYLTHVAPTAPPREALDAFVAAASERFRFVAFGLAPEVASALGLTPTFTSSTWSFGAPIHDPLTAHELTLV